MLDIYKTLTAAKQKLEQAQAPCAQAIAELRKQRAVAENVKRLLECERIEQPVFEPAEKVQVELTVLIFRSA